MLSGVYSAIRKIKVSGNMNKLKTLGSEYYTLQKYYQCICQYLNSLIVGLKACFIWIYLTTKNKSHMCGIYIVSCMNWWDLHVCRKLQLFVEVELTESRHKRLTHLFIPRSVEMRAIMRERG